uniref:Uncharacterized protein n=1 Tax=Oryza brachyantha TaxID=4533 RepID=J3N8M5_ORYBR
MTLKGYKKGFLWQAIEQVKLHEEFDRLLASGKLDRDICKLSSLQDDFIEEFVDKHIAKTQFVQVDKKLVILSLEQRAQLLDTQRQINAYAECLRNIMTDQKLQDGLQRLISELEDYRKMSQQSDSTLKDSFEQSVEILCVNWRQDLTQTWMATRYYEVLYYDVLRKVLKKLGVFIVLPVRALTMQTQE